MEIPTIGSFLSYWGRVRGRTKRVVLEIPPERIDWSHRVGAWSFGDLVRHLAAIERYMFAENARLRPSRYPGHGRELADGYEEVVEYLGRMHDETVEILSGLGDEQLLERCMTPGGVSLPVWKWLRAMVEHEAHHRGQIHLMLAMLEVPSTPLYGLTEEEVEAASKP